MSSKDPLDTAVRHAREFFAELPRRPVRPDATLAALRADMGGALPEEGADAATVIDDLDRAARSGLMANAGPRFFGFVIGGSLPVSVAAEWLTSAWDQNSGIYALSPAEAVAEESASAWLLELLELPRESSVGFVTGGQMANFTTLCAARYEVLRRVGWDVNENGLQGAPRVNVVVGEEGHITIFRALRYLGLGTASVHLVKADGQGRMSATDLERVVAPLDGPLIVCAQAGNVNSGSFDPFHPIADVVASKNGWLHVDGAFGLWAAVSPSRKQLVDGASRADSWAVDAHKWLNVPQDCGFAIVRDRAAHRAAVSTDAEYLIKSTGEERDAVDWNPEFSRRARGFAVWAAMRHLGRSGMRELVDRCCDLARLMAERLAASGRAKLLSGVVVNQALVQFVPKSGDANAFTRAVIGRIQNEGTCWLGGTTWKGNAAMRISVINWSTTEEDVERSVEAILRCVEAEERTGARP
jgi:glutamate/tyrosine decarboxylase-like PLP-dependent enzyme